MISESARVPGPWWCATGTPLMAAMSIASPVECSLTLPEVVMRLWPHLSEVIVRRKPLSARYSIAARIRASIWPVRMSLRPQE